MYCVAPLGKGMAIAGEARLAMNVDKLTELAIIISIEHLLTLSPRPDNPGEGFVLSAVACPA